MGSAESLSELVRADEEEPDSTLGGQDGSLHPSSPPRSPFSCCSEFEDGKGNEFDLLEVTEGLRTGAASACSETDMLPSSLSTMGWGRECMIASKSSVGAALAAVVAIDGQRCGGRRGWGLSGKQQRRPRKLCPS